ncbi:unnamed protein product [Effrenium voratum]|uniref:EF-hand domain-containing protein n=1 Tax=Effrenium voratum TaxID=2562239 RepID=A0AA36NJY0_9DINO|nr:unnamed protein product [Effrenium voratum]|mmetsp:Transcript_133908/g.317482  ORF Transcript_133908/g.317482 Transcript_133908/m.317482 type:complete len:668 (-) Transcript_133908:60-2063(-)
MSLCCADMMATKVGAEHKPIIVQQLVEDNPMAAEFLTTMSGQLQSLQQVIEQVTGKIVSLQDQINSKLSVAVPKEVTQGSLTSVDKTLEVAGDLDNLAERYSAAGAGKQNSEPSGEDEKEVGQAPVEEDPEIVELREQFRRCDVSSNGWVSAQELVAFAFSHGEQLQLNSVVKLCTYLSGSTRSSKRFQLDTVSEEQMKRELDVNGFLALRGDPGLMAGSPPEILDTAAALNRALDEENRIYKFENDQDTMKRRQRIALCRTFLDVGIVFVISLNALCIGISADQDPDSQFWEVLELVFFGIYTLECLVKLLLFDGFGYWVGPDWSWNIFDFTCLMISAVELSVSYIGRAMQGGAGARSQLSLLKVLRLARLARLVRVMRFKAFKELKLMALGLFSGLKALFWAIVLLMAVVFTMSVVTQSFFNEWTEFSTIHNSMFTLFRCFTEACETYDGDPLPEQLFQRFGPAFHIPYIITTMLVTVGLFNLIMAVFIDNVTKSQNQRKQKELGESAEMTECALKMVLAKFINEPRAGQDSKDMLKRVSEDALKKLASLTDAGRSRNQAEQRRIANEAFKVLEECHINITREVFQAWLKDPEFVRVLEEAEVDISNKFELFNILDVDSGGELSVEELLTGLMGLRGDVSKGDVVSILLRVRDILQRVERIETKM